MLGETESRTADASLSGSRRSPERRAPRPRWSVAGLPRNRLGFEPPRLPRLLVALVAVLATACSASTDQASSDPGADGCDTPGYSAGEIRLGFVYPDSGAGASALAAARSGFIARIEQANAAGGIHGRKLVYSWRDDGSSPTQNLEAVRDLVENENVFGILEASISAATGAEYLREHNIPVAGVPAEQFWADPQYRNMFAYAYQFTDGPSVSTYGEYIEAQGGTRAAVIENDVSPVDHDVATRITSSLASVGIPTVPNRFVFNPTITDPVQLGEKLDQANVDVVITTTNGSALAEIVRGVKAAGAPVKVVFAANGYDKGLLTQYGSALSGLSVATSYVPFEFGGPAHQAYLRAMQYYAPELLPPDQQLALVAYIDTDLFLYGLDKAGTCPTRDSFIDTLRASTYDAGGLLPGPVDLTRDFGQVNLCYTFMKINATGDRYDVVPNPNATPENPNRWCGHRLNQ
ncbi:ABC transporter substrate-binding protein [Frankia sp. CNm7]|uniref:ABC transporter substrate-binding protein n=1 Tax=Frankia nepalensis TaxID=1836974 RepID=A0A937RRU2_9ACTN|nr:ABC transporter substrate-binding protein [Frankia nepalensis]MBL7498932.1 ABC transporter substrate-binding protein [Frankia nepalensis]MBL7511271.1 ABC transporter substrate-binding protein [Frankia nepalensis]MBL7520555.1 ABC transporter substrate-binding protein [Frankia nepalensis]MBL7630791.1 ABC transporter substrate-binding protein [Frankia nepalensis]